MRPRRIAVLVVVVAFAGTVFYSLWNSEPLRISGQHLVRKGSSVWIEGTVENESGKPEKGDLDIKYYDGSGHMLGEDRVETGSLAAGESRSFRSLERDADRVADFSIGVNLSRNPYGN